MFRANFTTQSYFDGVIMPVAIGVVAFSENFSIFFGGKGPPNVGGERR